MCLLLVAMSFPGADCAFCGCGFFEFTFIFVAAYCLGSFVENFLSFHLCSSDFVFEFELVFV